MVNPWDDAVLRSIKLTKIRIKHLEKHGMGSEAMKEKNILKSQERHKELEMQKGRFR